MVEKEASGRAEFPVAANGLQETILATAASGAMAFLVAYMRATGMRWYLIVIAILWALSLRLALRVHALSWRDGAFRGTPLLGKSIEFRALDIASIAHDDRSRPPRARLELKDGRRILIKKPLWMGPVTADEFEAKVRERAEGSLRDAEGA
jgi:hypothetical protein